jgi:hypothetical protein
MVIAVIANVLATDTDCVVRKECLDTLLQLFKCGVDSTTLTDEVIDRVEALQYDENPVIHRLAAELIRDYIGYEEDDEEIATNSK